MPKILPTTLTLTAGMQINYLLLLEPQRAVSPNYSALKHREVSRHTGCWICHCLLCGRQDVPVQAIRLRLPPHRRPYSCGCAPMPENIKLAMSPDRKPRGPNKRYSKYQEIKRNHKGRIVYKKLRDPRHGGQGKKIELKPHTLRQLDDWLEDDWAVSQMANCPTLTACISPTVNFTNSYVLAGG